MLLAAEFFCSFCGEVVSIVVDPSQGREQRYVEDCQVCCRPNLLEVRLEPGGPMVSATPESD